jgi:hypothetical protein
MSARAPSGIGQGRSQTLDVGAGDLTYGRRAERPRGIVDRGAARAHGHRADRPRAAGQPFAHVAGQRDPRLVMPLPRCEPIVGG